MATITTAISAEGRVRSMANRHTLHISKLEDFKKWIVKEGWEIEEPKGIYEVLRARKQGRQNPIIVYTRADAKEHLSIMDRDSGVIGAFLRDCRKPKTNSDRIRSMSDEELAEFLERFGSFDQPCRLNKGEPLKWLQSEVEE